MPTIDQHQSAQRAKILVVGDPKSGKTSALASLANAGMRLFILDYDDNLAILRKLVKPQFHPNIIFETLRDRVVATAKGPTVKGMPQAFARTIQLLERWGDYGPVTEFGANDVLVIDTLTQMGAAAFWYTMYAAGRLVPTLKNKRPRDWGAAMERQEGVIQQLCSTEIKCNVVVNAHLTYLSGDDGGGADDEEGEEGSARVPAAPSSPRAIDFKRYPSALGKKLPPRIASYFDTVVMAKVVGAGPNAKRVIRTVPDADVDIAVPVPPRTLPTELPLEDGLARILRAIREEDGQTPTTEKKAA